MRHGILLVAAASMAAGPPTPADRFSEAVGAALQADAVRALKALEGVDLSGLPPRDHAAAGCMLDRFKQDSRAAPAASSRFADRALAIYRDYWHSAMTRPHLRQSEEQRLQARLRQLLQAPPEADFDALETLLSDKLKKDGIHSLQGRTGLLRELMTWSKQEERMMHARLPEGEHDVKVVLLDRFTSLGWGAYATCDRASTGGWATDKALFAVVPKYPSLDDEQFQVTFLGHEAQHFADKLRFKDMKPWELEYRAKLTELALANITRARVVGKFIDDQGDDPASPHSYANRLVLAEMMRKLELDNPKEIAGADIAAVNAAATELLREDSARRSAAQRHASR